MKYYNYIEDFYLFRLTHHIGSHCPKLEVYHSIHVLYYSSYVCIMCESINK